MASTIMRKSRHKLFDMKRLGNIYGKIILRENLELAFDKAKKGKTWQDKVKYAEAHRKELLDKLEIILRQREYKTSQYRTKTIYEPKKRIIYILPFYPDRIVQHAIMNVLEPYWDRIMHYHSYACRKGKGQHKGSSQCMKYIRQSPYCLKCDISKFYPSVNHEILYRILKRKIKCKYTLELLKEIIDSVPGKTNVPIGNYLSQWLGNMYLNELDDYIKHRLHIKHYIRYCDDFVLFGQKQELADAILPIKAFIRDKLNMKMSKCDLFPVSRGIDFLGYRHFPNNYILLRKSTAKRVKKRIKGLVWQVRHDKISKQSAMGSIESTRGWIKWANTHNLAMKLKLEEVKKTIEAFYGICQGAKSGRRKAQAGQHTGQRNNRPSISTDRQQVQQ